MIAATEPPRQRELFEAQTWEKAYRRFNPDDVPHLLIQLQDDLSRARKREAVWLSVILHLMVVILLWNSNRIATLLPHRTVPLELRADLDRDKDATFLELPPDEQKLTRRPESKFLSDKDRIATTKAPQINREELKKLLAASEHPGEPGANVKAPPATAPAAQPSQAAQNPAQAPPGTSQGFAQPQTSNQTARLQMPAQSQAPPPKIDFKTPMTAGSALEQAVAAAAASRGYSGSGQAGDGGLIRGRDGTRAQDQVEILTDTMGVDFWPYIQRVREAILSHWLPPPSFYPPILKQGIVGIDFYILPNGSVSSMVLHSSSGDVALDRAAWGSITGSNPFPPLPKEFHGQVFGLRCKYFYNLQPGSEMR